MEIGGRILLYDYLIKNRKKTTTTNRNPVKNIHKTYCKQQQSSVIVYLVISSLIHQIWKLCAKWQIHNASSDYLVSFVKMAIRMKLPNMKFPMITFVMILFVILAFFAMTAMGGPGTYLACYGACTTSCFAGTSILGPVSAAACTAYCAAFCAPGGAAPTP